MNRKSNMVDYLSLDTHVTRHTSTATHRVKRKRTYRHAEVLDKIRNAIVN